MLDEKSMNVKLAEYGQEHLLRFWPELSQEERQALCQDIGEIDMGCVTQDFQRAMESHGLNENLDKMEPIPAYGGVDRIEAKQSKFFEDVGYAHIADGKVAVLVLAGGQGTRLGVSYPKGMFNLNLPSGKTLFQLQAEKILKIQDLAWRRTNRRGTITWFIMTSERTIDPTVDFLNKHNYFGLDPCNVVIFEQFLLPAFDLQGKILLESKHRISLSPDGNGGLYRALRDRRVLDEMEKRGIVWAHAHSVDNVLTKIADPLFVGYCAQLDVDCGVKVVEKTQPDEPIGVVCIINGNYRVVEYSEISGKTAERRVSDGSLAFKAGNICNHLFSVSFLRHMATHHERDLPLHVAKKKIPTVGADGRPIRPSQPNGIKLEKFIFDAFPFATSLAVWEVKREEEFSALKNGDEAGKDCPKTARENLYRLHREWIKRAGGKVEPADGTCEISPLLSYGGEGLEVVAKGRVFTAPLLLKAEEES